MKTGFLGLVICLKNMFLLCKKITKHGMEYLLTYKLSQDYLETFFSAIRSRGGFNNNPNAFQFRTAYKRLLVRHEIKEVENGNCLFDGVEILHVSSVRRKAIYCDEMVLSEFLSPSYWGHDYLSTLWELNPYLENVVEYIGGYIANKM